jgi:pantoate--beta-alanine ligase
MRQAALAGETDVEILTAIARNILDAAAITIEYLDVREAGSLQTIHRLGDKPTRAFIAAKIGKTRLIDNMPLEFRPHEYTAPEPSTEEPR